MISYFRLVAVVAAILLLAGCAAKRPVYGPEVPSSVPSSVKVPSSAPPMVPPQVPSVEPPLVVPPAVLPSRPSENTAVVALMKKSQNQSLAGQWDAASASLERALRIEPRNPVLWQRLARVRLDQGNDSQAENLAAKSNSLSGNDQRLRSENWRIIGQARSNRGDKAGARAAFDRAESER